MMPDISDALRDSENSQVRMAVVQLLSMSAIKEISPSEFKSLLPTLVTLLSDSEEEVRITALQALSDLAKQDAFREAITRTLPPLLEASRRNEAKIRLAALRTCATLAQDITFRHIVNRAIPEILACVEDADDDVQNETMDTLSKLSRYDAFRLVVYEAAPHVISQLDIGGWEIRLLVLRTLSIFAQNDAFSEIISSVSPRIVECMKDKDYDVRVEALRNLLDLVQRSLYKDSIRDALQACGLATLVKLTSDDFVIVRMAVLSLIPKVIELGTFPGAAKMVMSALLKLLSDDDDDDDDECIVALEAIRALIEQDREGAYAKELTPGIPDLYKLLKPDLKTKVSTSLLLTLSAVVTRDEESVETVMNIISRLLLVIKDIHLEEPQFWAATAKVFLAIASLGGEPVGNVHTFLTLGVTSALSDSSRYARILGLMVMESIGQEIPEFKFDDCRPLVLKLLESEDFDIRLPAIRVADLFKFAVPGPREEGELHTAILNTWLQTVEHLKSPNPTAGVFEKMCKFAPYVDVFGSIHTIPAIVAALRGQYAIPVLRAISELAHSELGDALVPVVPKITAMLTSKNSDTQIRLEVLENLLRFADHGKLRIKIQEHVYAIIPFLKDRESKVRVAGLQVLLKLVQPVPPENLPDRIKLTLPTLLTLIQNSTTREDSVALITCLAGDKTLRSELLATLLPIILSTTETPTSWGQMVLIARLLEHRRLNLEESDLRFILCLITSKNTEVQDFMLKFMTKTLQQYLETWRNADKFPSGFASAFSSLAMLKR
ncbi:armadillo-type protein [Mycena sanguinolenta]|nr:armadillo-type protein [Mycena sanguinolenta]